MVAGSQERARTIISKLKADNVTTIVDGGDYVFNVVVTKEATTQLYQPEWIITGWGYNDVVLFARLNDQQQWAHAFGPGPVQVLPPPANFESGWGPGSLYYWQYGGSKSPSSTANIGAAWATIYLLFPCLQLAGPKLTPQTFRDGMFKYQPSPKAGGITNALISWGRTTWPWDDYNMYDDATLIWWDNAAQGPDELNNQGVGMYRYLAMVKRDLPGQFPETPFKAFDPANTVTVYDNPPGQDKAPDYGPEKDAY